MNVRLPVSVAVVAIFLAACADRQDVADSDGKWIGTITTEGNVTTVVNESGSVWGGTATLVEELSIGVDRGEPPYMLGPPRTVWDDGDLIIVPDIQVPTIRVFDTAGSFVGEIGRAGQGPGEYQYPWSAIRLSDGRFAVSNSRSDWVEIFSADLSYQERWNATWEGGRPERLSAHGLMHLGDTGVLYLTYLRIPDPGELVRTGFKPIGPGAPSTLLWEPERDEQLLRNCLNTECTRWATVAYGPEFSFPSLTPSGGVVSGFSDEYRLEIEEADGTKTIIERRWDPVPVDDEEWEYWTQRQRAYGLSSNPAWRPGWSDDVPRHKPAFSWLHAGRSGRILVVREGPSRRIEPCTEDPQSGDSDFVPCWESTWIWDMFDADGRYLGEIASPGYRMSPFPFLDDRRLTMAVTDDAGTIMIKRYRLVLPGEE